MSTVARVLGIGFWVLGFGFTLTFPHSEAQGVRYETKAAALLRDVQRATLAAKSLQADVVVARGVGSKRERVAGPVRLMRPNLVKVEMRGRLGQTVASDGKVVWVHNAATNQYVKRKPAGPAKEIARTFGPLIPLAFFFDPTIVTAKTPQGTRVRLESPVIRRGIRYDILALITPGIEIRLFISPERIVHRSITTSTRGKEPASIDTELTGLRLNAPLPRTAFSYKPPKSARELPGPIEIEVAPPSGKPKP